MTKENTIDNFNYSYQFNLNSMEVTITGNAAENLVGISSGDDKESWTMPEDEQKQLVKRFQSMKVSDLPGDLLPECTVEVTKE